MPQEYKRKTNRGSNPDFLERAAADVQGGSSIRSAAILQKIMLIVRPLSDIWKSREMILKELVVIRTVK